jgi:hypothetical protein
MLYIIEMLVPVQVTAVDRKSTATTIAVLVLNFFHFYISTKIAFQDPSIKFQHVKAKHIFA